MTLSTSLHSAGGTLVLDASAIINFLAIDLVVARDILRATEAKLVASKRMTVREICQDPRDRSKSIGPRLDALTEGNLIEFVSIDGLEEQVVEFCFEVDDGEAETMAYAAQSGAVAVIDDEPARRVAERAGIELAWTGELLLRPQARAAVGEVVLAQALYDALHFGRMRVARQHIPEIVALIGFERAEMCRSLPRRWLHDLQQRT
jgi:predicted nucleic acid-binding protein